MEVKVKTGVKKEPLAIDKVSNYIKYDESMGDEVSLIKDMITTARQLSEKYVNMAFAEQTLVAFFDKWDMDDRKILLPYSPHSRLVKVSRLDQEGGTEVLTENTGFYKRGLEQFELDVFDTIGVGEANKYEYTYKIEYVAGFGITVEEGEEGQSTSVLPKPIELAMLKQISQWYDNRENFQPVLSMEVMELLSPYSKNPYN